jgi:serine/threonine protein kinase
MDMQELPEVGDEFAGYLLQSVIGHGAMSVVYEAAHPRLGNGIALKVLAAQVAADDIFRTRFLDESGIAASMNHPHVIPIYDVGGSDGLLYIAMLRVSGGDLRQRIAKRGPLPPSAAVSMLSQATRALDAAHRIGLVHRDVKPENLLIEGGDEAGSEHLYLADFGISRLGMERNGLTSTGRFLGTTDYVAPEQITEPYVYGSADQYSLGCVLYECLTGRVPFEKDLDAASTRPALRTGLPPAVEEMFARVLAERPGDRYNTCREFMAAASVALADLGTAPLYSVAPTAVIDQPEVAPEPADDQQEPTHEVPAPGEGPGSGNGRHRLRWLVIAAALLLICAGGAGAYAALSSPPKANASPPSVMTSKPMPQPARVSALTRVLTAADASKVAMGLLPPSSCRQKDATMVICTAPSPAIARATFLTYPTLTALYSAYEAQVRSLNSGRYQSNVKDCGLSAPSPYGEIAWNHREQHSRAYTVAEMIDGKVSVVTAMGRMACTLTASHSEDIVWTTDYGKMLGIAIGSEPHSDVWTWWIAIHHNIIFPGTPMDMGDRSVSLMEGAPMPTTSASPSPSMPGGASPSMSK